MTIRKLINICDEIVTGNANVEETKEVVGVFENILEHIGDFIYSADYDMVSYPIEYFHRNDEARNAALEAFSSILEEMDGYLYD